MIISQLRYDPDLEFPRVSAQIIWEKAERAPFDLFFETNARYASDMSPDPNALLLGCFLPAWRAREDRIVLDGPICPMLAKNLRAASAIVRTWYPEAMRPPKIQSENGFDARMPEGKSSVSMLSCGIDSLATLRWNKLNLPKDHPDSISGVIVFVPKKSDKTHTLAVEGTIDKWSAASRIASDLGAEAIPVLSNLWWLVANGYFYDYVSHGALLTSMAYLFGRRFRKVWIASAHLTGHLEPWGTHPMLDPYHSSCHFQVQHDGLEMSRLEKLALIADWPVGLDNIRVCQNDSAGDNCGRCEKCIRTQIALLALGKLAECSSFPNWDVGPDLIERLWKFDMLAGAYDRGWYPPLLQPLRDCGRTDVADLLADVLSRYRTRGEAKRVSEEIWS